MLEFWAVRETKESIRVYGRGASISATVGSAVDTLYRLHPDSGPTRQRILASLVSNLPAVYWQGRAEWTRKEIVDLTKENQS